MYPAADDPSPGGLWPTWRYWAGVLVGLPTLLVLATYVATLPEWQVPEPVPIIPVVVVLAGAVTLILRERHVRTMTGGQKATWTFIGLVLGFVVWAVVVAALIAVTLSIECPPEARCFD